ILPYWMARYYGVVAFTPTTGLSLTLNQAIFHTGNQLILNATVTTGLTPVQADVYIALQPPGCTSSACLLFWQGGSNFTPTPQPLLGNWLVSSFAGPIFSYTFGCTDAVGPSVSFGGVTMTC